MKILHIITQGENGGGQKAVLDLAEKFQTSPQPSPYQGEGELNQVFIATGKRENKKDNWLTDNFKGESFEIKSLERSIDFTFRKEIKAILEIYKLVKKIKPDVVHLHSVKAGTIGAVAAKIAGAKVVYTVHGIILNEPMNIFKKIFYWASEFIASFFRDREIFVSKKDFEIAKKYFISNDEKGVVIYNGLDFQKFENVLNENKAREFIFEKILETSPSLSLSGEGQNIPKIVGTIANFYKTKGLEYLIEAAAKVVSKNPDVIFVVFGDGDLRVELEELIRKNALKKNFFLLGAVSDAYKYLKALDLFVLPSVKEGMPYAILEAAIADRKIVATRVGGVEELRKYININLVESKNVDELAREIENTILEKDFWIKEENKNQDLEKIEASFELEQQVEKISKIYKEILKV
jgi:glycosyltransferase involved in cell wall biosynthesis